MNRRVLALLPSGGQSELEIIDNRDQAFEQRTIGILNPFIALAGGALFVILKVSLSSQCQIAKAIKIALQTRNQILLRSFCLIGTVFPRYWRGHSDVLWRFTSALCHVYDRSFTSG